MEKFSGTSVNGDIKEAISDACKSARNKLQTDYIEWKLLEISGSSGGFAEVDTIQVQIEAKTYSS